MKFLYKKFPLSERNSYFGSSLLKPIINVKIKFETRELRYDVLIDSGADFCIFDAEIGEYLGIDIQSGIKVGFGGIQESKRAVAYLHNVILIIGGYEYKTTVGFSYDIARNGYGILGQKGFFELFTVIFGYLKEEIELREKKS